MLVGTPVVMCTGKPEPREWTMNGRSGISYKVNISDGSSTLELPVKDAETWNRFAPFAKYHVTIELTQSARENRIATRCRVVDLKEAE